VSDVYVVGSLNADHRVRVSRIPKAGETLLGSEIVVAAGGKGANQAVAASRAGATAVMIGASGDDTDGQLVRDTIARQGVDAQHVHIVRGARTGRALITVDDHGANTIVVSPGANARLTDQDVSAGLRSMGVGDLLLLQLETPERLVRHAARTAAEGRRARHRRDLGATAARRGRCPDHWQTGRTRLGRENRWEALSVPGTTGSPTSGLSAVGLVASANAPD
jgi:ribokinase